MYIMGIAHVVSMQFETIQVLSMTAVGLCRAELSCNQRLSGHNKLIITKIYIENMVLRQNIVDNLVYLFFIFSVVTQSSSLLLQYGLKSFHAPTSKYELSSANESPGVLHCEVIFWLPDGDSPSYSHHISMGEFNTISFGDSERQGNLLGCTPFTITYFTHCLIVVVRSWCIFPSLSDDTSIFGPSGEAPSIVATF